MSVRDSLEARGIRVKSLVADLQSQADEVGSVDINAPSFELGRIHGLNEAMAIMMGVQQECSAQTEARIRAELAADRRIDVSTTVAAMYLGKSAKTLHHWACKGIGPIAPTVKEGVGKKRCRWRVADIRRILGVKPT